MPGYRTCVFILALILGTLPSTQSIASGPRLLAVEDMMKMEGFGAATVDPTGRWLIFERLRPYEQLGDFSFHTYAFARSGHQLWQYDLKKGGAPKPLPGIASAPSTYLQGFAPSGRYLAVMQYRLGALLLGAYDIVRQRMLPFQGTPAFSRDGAHNPIWVSNSELMFAALPAGEQPDYTSARVHTGRALEKAWNEAWRGNIATASEVRTSTTVQPDRQEPGTLVRADARTGKAKIFAQGLYADLRVSPDYEHVAALAVFKPKSIDPKKLAEDEPRRYRLTVFDLKTGDARALAAGLEFLPYSIAWSPDGVHVTAYGWTAGEGPSSGSFFVINVRTGAIIRYDHRGLELVDERERGFFWRPERTVFIGDSLAVFARKASAGGDQSARFAYHDIRPTNLSKPDWYALKADGTSKNLTDGLKGVGGVPVHAGGTNLTVVADDGVYRLDADGTRRRLTPALVGRFRPLSPGTFATGSGVIRPDFTDEALFAVTGNGPAKIVMVDLLQGHEGKTLIVNAPSTNAMPLAGSLATGAVLLRTETGPVSQLMVAKADTNVAPQEIARINTHMTTVDFGSWKVVSYSVNDGGKKRASQTIESCVLLPPGYDPKSPPPLIVEVYPDARSTCKDDGPKINMYTLNWSPYLWAGRGYAYARLTMPNASIRTATGPIAGMQWVVDAGLDALVSKGFADPKRLALVGYSQGGVSALYVAAKSDRFRAVIAMNSWADLFSEYFGPSGVYSSIYGKYFGDFERYDKIAGGSFGIGRTPFEDPEVYIRNSPVFLAPQINAPVMLIHSDMDGFSMSQFDEMYGALLRAGKDARYVRYWGEGHGPSSPANIRDMWKRIDGFLAENGVSPAEH